MRLLPLFSSLCLTILLQNAPALGDILTPQLFAREQERLSVPARPHHHSSNPIGSPNIVARLEVTTNGTQTDLFCGKEGDKYNAGYAHFTDSAGREDKHMFWWLFEARHDPENAPVVLTLGGGPGASGMLFPFSGAGPCLIHVNEDGRGEAIPSPYSWTEHVNLLAIDHPIGVGFSYGDLRNSSATAAWDVDDFLQLFWAEYPHLAKNSFLINGGSYGGTFVPNIISAIHIRNAAPSSLIGVAKRIPKMPDATMLVNVWSDVQTQMRWFHQSTCVDNEFFNSTLCAEIVSRIPECLDAIQYAYEQPMQENKFGASESCLAIVADTFGRVPERDPYDARTRCPLPEGCDMGLQPIADVLNSDKLKDLLGVPRSRPFNILSMDVGVAFTENGDFIQPAYKLLGPAIEDGLRVLIYNGMADGMAPWRSSLAWMRLLETKHQSEFRSAPEIAYPGVGTMIQSGGGGSGNFTLVKVEDAGHMVIRTQPELVRHLLIKWLKNEPFF